MAVWAAMMAAMMLPGAVPAASRYVRATGRVLSAPVFAQKLLQPRAAIDVPVALAIIGLGAVITIAPSAVPGLTLTN